MRLLLNVFDYIIYASQLFPVYIASSIYPSNQRLCTTRQGASVRIQSNFPPVSHRSRVLTPGGGDIRNSLLRVRVDLLVPQIRARLIHQQPSVGRKHRHIPRQQRHTNSLEPGLGGHLLVRPALLLLRVGGPRAHGRLDQFDVDIVEPGFLEQGLDLSCDVEWPSF